jgi:DNA polymerase-1
VSNSNQRLYLIDGYSNIFRAFYAIRHLSNSKGEPTNAVYGFLQILRKLLRDEAPELVGIALDMSGPTIRNDQFEDYKANRAPMPEELRPQIPQIRRVIEAHRIPILEAQGYEADDVLGTLARKAAASGVDVVLVSADKDLMQLVDDRVSLYHTGRDKLYGPSEVEEDFGVPPNQVVEVLALKGDAVDNVPGVPGIGEKGALQLIRQFGSLETTLDRADEVSRKSYREGLQNHRDQAILSKELVTIHTDLPIEFSAEDLRHEDPDFDVLRDLYRELEFQSLLEELDDPEHQISVEPATEVVSVDDWKARVDGLGTDIALAVVGETDPIGLAVCEIGSSSVFCDFRHDFLRPAVVETLEDWLRDRDRRILGHDLKEILRLTRLESTPEARLDDLMLMSYVARPSQRAHTLEEIAFDRLGYQARSAKDVGLVGGDPPESGSDELLDYAAERVEVPCRLEPSMQQELADSGLIGVYRDLEIALMPVLVRMEEAGVLLDCDFLSRMSDELATELKSLESEIFELAGEQFNINSPRQLGVILFEKLGYPVIKKTKKTKSYSTSAEILQLLAQQGLPLPDLLLRYREINKLKSTYVDALPSMVHRDGRIRTRFQQAVAATGRLSSVNPNLQNIPIRTELGQSIRKAFIAPPGRRLLVADYNQIELRVLAHIAQDQVLIEAFAAGEDVHSTTAAAVFGVAPELVTVEQRRAAKTINFGIIYGISAFGLANNLGIRPDEADSFIRTYLERYPGVRQYIDDTLEEVEATGKVSTMFGRQRPLPEINSRNRNLRENAKRMAINARIQGTAADLLKKAMINLDHRLQQDHRDSRILLTVHDELVLEVPSDETDRISQVVREEMEGVESLDVPLIVDIGSGSSWFEAKT